MRFLTTRHTIISGKLSTRAKPATWFAINATIMRGKMNKVYEPIASELLRRVNSTAGLMERFVDQFFSLAMKLSFKIDLPLIKPLTAVVSISDRCNSRCVYCNSWKVKNEEAAPVKEWLSIVKQLSEIGITEVIFSGGEPLMSCDLDSIIHSANAAGIFTHVISNGILLTEERMLKLVESGVKGVTLSIDSLDELEYTSTRGIPFEYASRALDVLFRSKKQFPYLYAGINVVVTARNFLSYGDLIELASSNGVYVAFQSYTSHPDHALRELMPSRENEKAFQEAIQLIKDRRKNGKLIATSLGYLDGILPFMKARSVPADFRCFAGYLGINIDSKLNVMPCWNMPPVGNLRQSSIEEIWYSHEFHAARVRMRKLQCPKCWILCHTDVESMTRRKSRKRV
jgi:MoaA/NifB/PqqE/SkfB family radical SAM enzyme